MVEGYQGQCIVVPDKLDTVRLFLIQIGIDNEIRKILYLTLQTHQYRMLR